MLHSDLNPEKLAWRGKESPADIKTQFRRASVLESRWLVFNIKNGDDAETLNCPATPQA